MLTARQLPNTLAAANTAEAGLNSEAANLMKSLMAQSGNGTQLTIASAVWTNKTSVLKPYSDSMLKLLQASSALHGAAAVVATCSPACVCLNAQPLSGTVIYVTSITIHAVQQCSIVMQDR